MSKKSHRPSRATRSARRKHIQPRHDRVQWPYSIHKKAIEVFQAQIRKGTGIPCLFHGGAQWTGLKSLLVGNGDALICLGASLRIGNRRWIPDLTVRCKATGTLLLAIEVWHTHSVSPTKRACYLAAGIPWIEVKAWNVLERIGKKTLSILDWGGIAGVESPFQGELFEQAVPKPVSNRVHQRMTFDLRSKDWPMPQASQHALEGSSVDTWYGSTRSKAALGTSKVAARLASDIRT